MTRAPEPKKALKSGRDQRLAAALRENLHRRKAQARGRSEAPEKPARPDPDSESRR